MALGFSFFPFIACAGLCLFVGAIEKYHGSLQFLDRLRQGAVDEEAISCGVGILIVGTQPQRLTGRGIVAKTMLNL